MINVKIGRHAYSMSFVTEQRTFGRNEIRPCVIADIYEYYQGIPTYLNRGIAICHPQDSFDPLKGAKKALASATWIFRHDERKIFQTELESWFSQNGQDV